MARLKTNCKAVKTYFEEIAKKYSQEDVQRLVSLYNSDNHGRYQTLIEFEVQDCQCLVNTIEDGIAYYVEDMRSQIRVALQETIEESEAYNEDKVCRLYYYLMQRAFDKVFSLGKTFSRFLNYTIEKGE